MFDVEETDFGIKVDLNGYMEMEEVQAFCEEFESLAETLPAGWATLADHQNLSAIPDGADDRFAEMMGYAMEQHVGPTVVVVDSAIAAMQQRRMKDEIDIEGQKVLNAEDYDDWEREARDWIRETDVVNGQ